MSHKTKAYTKKHLHRLRLRQAEERKKQRGTSVQFWHRHDGDMRRALHGVDLDRFEELAR